MLPRNMKTEAPNAPRGRGIARPPASRDVADPPLAEPWIPEWAGLALKAGGAGAACIDARVTPADIASARRGDSALDDLCRDLDRAVDRRVADRLRAGAVAGDARSQSLYLARGRGLFRLDDGGPADHGPLPASVAEAMISAGLAAWPADPPPRDAGA